MLGQLDLVKNPSLSSSRLDQAGQICAPSVNKKKIVNKKKERKSINKKQKRERVEIKNRRENEC